MKKSHSYIKKLVGDIINRPGMKYPGEVIDIEGEVIEDNQKQLEYKKGDKDV